MAARSRPDLERLLTVAEVAELLGTSAVAGHVCPVGRGLPGLCF
jgi:hypothetical protein